MFEGFEKELGSLDPAVQWELQKIEGYLQMKMPAQARRVMGHLPASMEQTGLFRLVQMHLASIEDNWKCAAQHAARLVEDYPRSVEYWIQWAYALRRAVSLDAAEKVLLKGLIYFPEEAIFHYNLGCYASVQGRCKEALDYLNRAFELESGFRQVALEDEDLESVWPILYPE